MNRQLTYKHMWAGGFIDRYVKDFLSINMCFIFRCRFLFKKTKSKKVKSASSP